MVVGAEIRSSWFDDYSVEHVLHAFGRVTRLCTTKTDLCDVPNQTEILLIFFPFNCHNFKPFFFLLDLNAKISFVTHDTPFQSALINLSGLITFPSAQY
jgi:hypothetical protein